MIAEKDGKAVGLQVVHIIDEGETAIAQSLRVHLEYRRQGIGKRLIEECRNYVKENFPQVKFERYASSTTSPERLAIQKKSNDVLFHTAVFFGCVVNGHLESHFSDQLADLKKLDIIEFESVLMQSGVTDILFKNEFIINCRFQPFKALVSNIQHGMVKEGNSIYASYSGESIESLSTARWCPTEIRPRLVSVFYTLDKKLLQAHILKQLENAVLQHPGKTFTFVALIDKSLVDCVSQLLLNDLLLKISEDGFGIKGYKCLYFFEKNLA